MIVTDRMLECRNVPYALVFNHDTPEQALVRTVRMFVGILENAEIRNVSFDEQPYINAITQLIVIWKKPVEIVMR